MALPPDRAAIPTEGRNPRSIDLHRMDIAAIVDLMRSEDRRVLDAIDGARAATIAVIDAAEPRFCAGGRLIYVGAGTSGRLGVLDASEAPPTFQVGADRVIGIIAGGDASLRRSSEGREDEFDGAAAELAALDLDGRDTVIAIAAGGSTPYALGALAHAKRLCPATLTALICCTQDPPASQADHVIALATGPEILTGSTRLKAGTATKLTLNTISTTLMVRLGKTYQNLMVDVRATNDKLRDRAARIVSDLTGLPRPDAFLLLDRAGGAVKTAVVMHRRNLTRERSEALLDSCDGRLDRALGG